MPDGKEMLQEQLDVIMKYQKRTWITLAISMVIIIAAVCAVFVLGPGAITPTAADDHKADALETASMQSAIPTTTSTATPEPASMQSGIQSTAPAATPEPASMQSDIQSTAPVTTPESEIIQSFFQSPAAPDQDYLDRLLQSAIDVNTVNEFTDALKTCNTIVVKKDMDLSGNDYFFQDIPALVIDEGVTLTITSLNFYPNCSIVNFGEIIVADYGRMIFFHEPDYSCIGKISIKGSNAVVGINTGKKIGADEVAYFLSEDSLFNGLYIVAASSGKNLVEILIDHDIVIPAGKTLWINADSVLHVPEGVTLTNNGFIRYQNKPIIEGKIIGTGKEFYD